MQLCFVSFACMQLLYLSQIVIQRERVRLLALEQPKALSQTREKGVSSEKGAILYCRVFLRHSLAQTRFKGPRDTIVLLRHSGLKAKG